MLSNLKSRLFKFVKSKKLNVFGFFLLLSSLFLMIAKLSKTYTETIVYHVKFENVPEEHSITKSHDSIMKVRVEAYGFNLVVHNFYKHIYSVDFNKEVRENGSKYIWYTKKSLPKISSQLGSKIEVLSIQPDSLSFPYEIMTVKTVPMKLNAEITYALGYDILDSLQLEPDSIKVIGPRNTIEKISKIQTKELKLKDVNTPISQEINLDLDTSLKNVKLSQYTVKLSGTVEKFTEGSFEVPVKIINLPTDVKINYFPKTVLVSYYVSLENYKKVKTLDFKVVCDYNEVKNLDKTFFTPKLVEKPDSVKSARIKQNKVEFILIE